MGTAVSENDLSALDEATDFSMPPELRQFYLEVGDGFAFVPDDRDASNLVGWDYMHLADHKVWNLGFGSAIEEEAMRELGTPSDRTNPQPCTRKCCGASAGCRSTVSLGAEMSSASI